MIIKEKLSRSGLLVIPLLTIAIVLLIVFTQVPQVYGSKIYTSPLYAGGSNYKNGIDCGEVVVHSVDNALAIAYIVDSDWTITDTAVGILDKAPTKNDKYGIPTTKSGNPKVGNFPFNEKYELGDYDSNAVGWIYDDVEQAGYYEPYPAQTAWDAFYVISIDDIEAILDITISSGTDLYLACHCVLTTYNSITMTYSSETGWADSGYSFQGNSWALYFKITMP